MTPETGGLGRPEVVLGPDTGRISGEGERKTEKYEDIRNELLLQLQRPPSEERNKTVTAIQRRRRILLDKAKSEGIFVDISRKVKDIRAASSINFDLGIDMVQSIRASDYEDIDESGNLVHPEYEGMISDWLDGAVTNMRLKWAEANLSRLLSQTQGLDQQKVNALTAAIDSYRDWIAVMGMEEAPIELAINAKTTVENREKDRLIIQLAETIQKMGEEKSKSIQESEQSGKENADAELIKLMLEQSQTGGSEHILQPLPTHVRAIFKEGRNRMYRVSDKRQIVELDIRDKDQRWEFLLRNLEAFNNIFGDPAAWNEVYWNWYGDAQDSARSLGIENGPEFSDFEMMLNAGMAITASARLMEISGGQLRKYLAMITGGQEPDTTKQTQWKSRLLHGDESKIATVLKHEKVDFYFRQLLKSAGFKEKDVDKLKTGEYGYKDIMKLVEGLSAEDVQRLQSSVLVDHLSSVKSKAKGVPSGFDGYISSLNLSSEGDRFCERQCAKLACDVFLTTIFTEYDYRVTESYKKYPDYKITPSTNWIGNPFAEVLKPSNAPQSVKNVFEQLKKPEQKEDKGENLWNLFNSAFRIRDNGIINTYDYYQARLFKANAVTSTVILEKFDTALFAILGGADAPLLADLSQKGIESITTAAINLRQAYKANFTDKDEAKVVPILTGLAIARIILAKSMAFDLLNPRSKGQASVDVLIASEDSRVKLRQEFRNAMFGNPNLRGGGFVKAIGVNVPIDFSYAGTQRAVAQAWLQLEGLSASETAVAETVKLLGNLLTIFANPK